MGRDVECVCFVDDANDARQSRMMVLLEDELRHLSVSGLRSVHIYVSADGWELDARDMRGRCAAVGSYNGGCVYDLVYDVSAALRRRLQAFRERVARAVSDCDFIYSQDVRSCPAIEWRCCHAEWRKIY